MPHTNYLSEADKALLRSIPLQDVMEKNGYFPVHRKDNEYIYNCPMPGHEDRDASFHVELYPDTSGTEPSYARYNCFSKGDIRGMGAISLQADLLGVSTSDSLMLVVKRLCADHGIRIKGISTNCLEWKTVEPVNEFQWSECAWTDEHLRALGCFVSPRFEDNYRGVHENTGEKVYSWSYVGDINYETQRPMPFEPSELGRIFGVYPIDAFTTPAKEKDGHRYSLHATSPEGNCVFIIKSVDAHGNWRVKKYEPQFCSDPSTDNYKWTWWYQGGKNRDRDFAGALYGDCDVVDALYNADVIPTDSSTYHNHPTVPCKSTNEKGEDVDVPKFKRVCICSGPRDAMQVYYHSDMHVVYPHSESAVIDKRLILRLFKVSNEVYILYDADATGRQKARELNLEYLQMRNIELPADMSMLTARRNGKPCKDVSDFFERYYELMRKQPKNAKKTLNERFEALICDAKPLKFWIKMYNKSLDSKTGGEVKYKYTFVTDNIKRFCEAHGFVTVNDGNIIRFARLDRNIVTFIPDNLIITRVHECMKEWLSLHPYHNDPALCTQIDMSNQYITLPILQGIRNITISHAPVSDRLDYFFFRNGALKITPTEETLIPYDRIPFFVNAEKVKPYDYIPMQDTFSIVPNTDVVERLERQRDEEIDATDPSDKRTLSAIRKKWKEEIELNEYTIEWHVPMHEQPEVVQYIWDTCRKYWEDEDAAQRAGDPSLFTDYMQKVHVRHFINKVAGLGFLLCSHWSSSMSMILYLLDGSVDKNTVSSGRTGKSILASLVNTVRSVVKIPGKNFKTSVEESAKNFVEYDYRLHDVININDLAKSARAECFNNWAEGEIRIKRNYKDEFNIPQGFEPKMVISANKMFDMSDTSTSDRYWRMYFHDYYHAESYEHTDKYSPAIKFGHNIPDTSNEVEFQGCIHFLLRCLQFYQAEQRYIKPPKSTEEIRRELEANTGMERGFAEWADRLFEKGTFYGVPLPKRDLVISYLQYTNASTNNTNIRSYMQSTKFGEMMDIYCNKYGISPNPDICFIKKSDRTGKYPLPKTRAWVYDIDSNGNALSRRVYATNIRCYYFFPSNDIPKTVDKIMYEQSPTNDPACEGYILE